MRILLIRHGEPDYAIDGLTEKGKREVALLAKKLAKEKIDKIYSSPRGRAKLTAEPTCEALGMEMEILPFMREFNVKRISLPYMEKPAIPWDILPAYINEKPHAYDPKLWQETDFIKSSEVYEEYLSVCREFDALLARHGYERDGYNYKAVRPNHDTIAIFCHFGVIAVIMSHLMHCSPYSLWQHTCALPTSVTTIYTEERREGVALMRAAGFGDISHLYAEGEAPSFYARFCECFTDDTTHDD
jgi:probable phosphoglycerate mutase